MEGEKVKQDFETQFQSFFTSYPGKVLRGCKIIKKEVPLYRAYDLLKRELYENDENGDRKFKPRITGRIDILFKYQQSIFAGEIKFYTPHNHEFWHAIKILAYTAYLNYQYQFFKKKLNAKAAILVPQKSIRLEHRIVAAKLRITLFGIERNEKGFKMQKV